MSWPQWSSTAQPPVPSVPSVLNPATPVINSAPAVVPPGLQYTPDQWAQLQQQNWHQWAQWQQQYQQWHQQYGAEYQKSINALAQAAQQPALPNVAVPPPLPAEIKQPPLPTEDPPPPIPSYTTAPPAQPPSYNTPPLPKTNERPAAPFPKINQGQNWQNQNTRYNEVQGTKRSYDQQGGDQDMKRQMMNKQGWQNQPPIQSQPPPLMQQTVRPPPKENVEELSEAEKKFDKQFAEWEAQFNKWKEQNAEHPDKEQYREYEKKWESWRAQLLERREQMKRKRLGLPVEPNRGRPPPTQGYNQPAQQGYNSPQSFNQPQTGYNQPPPKPAQNPPTNVGQKPPLPKPALLPTPTSGAAYNKPPPNLNDEPLKFKMSKPPAPSITETEENVVDDFIKPNTSGGIPGLDLVKDDPKAQKESEDVVVIDPETEKKGPDFDAISKGINTILGDQKLLNMLSMVSQNQNAKMNDNLTNTVSKIKDTGIQDPSQPPYPEQTNQSFEDHSNQSEGHTQREFVNNFDDQTRSSFTTAHNEQEMRYDSSGNFGRNQKFDQNQFSNRFGNFNKGGRFGGPENDQFNKNNFGRNDFNERQPRPDNSERFPMKNDAPDRRFPPGPRNEPVGDRFGPKNERQFSGPKGDQDRFGSSQDWYGPNEECFGPNEERFGPNEDRFGGGPNQGRFKSNQGRFGSSQDRFGPNQDLFEPNPDRFGPNQDKFEANQEKFGPNQDKFGPNQDKFGPNHDKFGPNQDKFGPSQDKFGSNQGRFGPSQDRFGPSQDRFGPNQDRFGPNQDRFGANQDRFGVSQDRFGPKQDRFGPNQDRFGSNQDRFGPNQDRFGPAQDRFGPKTDRFGPNKDRFRSNQDRFGPNQDRFGLNQDRFGANQDRFGPNQDRFEPNQNRFGPNQDRFGPGKDRFAQERQMGLPRGDYYQDNPDDTFDPRGEGGFNKPNNDRGFGPRGGPGERQMGPRSNSDPKRSFSYEDDDYNKDPFEQEDFDQVPPPEEDYGENYDYDRPEPHYKEQVDTVMPPEETNLEEPWKEEGSRLNEPTSTETNVPVPAPSNPDILQPATVIDYDHKSLKNDEPEILLEPIYMFDYRHKPLSRIPLPQRPKWLSDSVKNIREFDPPVVRPYEPSIARPYETPNLRRYPPPVDNWRKDRYPEDRWSPHNRRNYNENRPQFDDRRPSYGENRSFEDSKSFNRDWSPAVDRKREDKQFEEKERKQIPFTSQDFGEEKISDTEWPDDDELEQTDKKAGFAKLQKSDTVNKSSSNKSPVVIEDLIYPPGRYNRPPRIVIILRGPPGSGKTFLAKLIKDKEVENGGSTPRILSLDDYFMVEQEKEVTEEGKKVKIKEMVYEYEAEMEESYRTSLVKSFKKTITDGYFSFIIVDNINDKVKYFGEMWSFAKQNGFQVYICQLDLDVQTCSKRNIHGRSETDIEKCVAAWEPTPSHHPVLDATSLLQSASIPEVEMEEVNSPETELNERDGSEDQVARSKWDNFDCSIDNLAKLDGVSKPLRHSRTMEEYLQLDTEWTPVKPTKPGQKRVRWADLEEQKQQEKMRAIGFVVGQTNWDRMLDPTKGGSALTQTKYIERTGRFKVDQK